MKKNAVEIFDKYCYIEHPLPNDEKVLVYYPNAIEAMEEYATQPAPDDVNKAMVKLQEHLNREVELKFLQKKDVERINWYIDTYFKNPQPAPDGEKWISVEERLPEVGQWYLVVERNQVNFLFYNSVDIWLNNPMQEDKDDCFYPTHWQPLPAIPNTQPKPVEAVEVKMHVERVVIFALIDGVYLDSDGNVIDTETLVRYNHEINNGEGIIWLDRPI